MKTLIVYFSHSGNTRGIAHQIQEQAGGDLLEIQPVVPYPRDYDTVVQQVKRELKTGFKPVIKASGMDIQNYGKIFLGSPNWWSTIAPPLRSFLADNDLSGKIIIPFMTHGGGGSGRSFEEIASLCPNATILEGIAVFGGPAKASRNQILTWLGRLKMGNRSVNSPL